ncbi:MAG TPA: hypothetical protein VFB28_09070 [Terriglobales bacterium]|nr:hypothetical protein [Terriglobales bacterium]
MCAAPLFAREKTKKEDYGLGYSTEVPGPEAEVLQALQDVVNNGIIEGSKEYSKDKYIEKAVAADSSPLFEPWSGGGKVLYKVRTQVLSPTNFKDSNDEGTLAVRYILQSKTAEKSILRIDAVFVEDFRHTVHRSNGSVESAEYKDIQDHLETIQLKKKQAEEGERQRQEELAKQSLEQKRQQEQIAEAAAAQTSAESLEQHVQNLRHQLERVVKTPGAELKSAPFQSATNLKLLQPGAEVLILVTSTYWYGVETEDSQHGWIHRGQLEPLP